MKEKRGISAIVAVVLTILMTVIAVMILWTSVLPNINLEEIVGVESSLNVRMQILTTGGYTVYDEASHFAFVQVKRGVDDAEIVALEIIFSVEGNSVKLRTKDAPAINGMETYPFDFDYYGIVGIPSMVSVAPIFVRGSGEKTGDILSKVDMPIKKISEITFGDRVKARNSKSNPSTPVCGDKNCQNGETCFDGIGDDCLVDCNICPMQVAYWNFDNDDAVDVTGHGNDGELFNSSNDILRAPIFVDTPWGRGLKVSGDGTARCNGVRVDDSNWLDVSEYMTISAWVKYDSFRNHGKIVVKAFQDDSNDIPWEIYSLDIKGSGGNLYPNFLWSDGDTGSGNDQIGDESYYLNIGEWYHITGVLDGVTARLYVNGTMIAEDPIGEFMAINDQSFYIGGVNTLGFCTNGTIDEVMIFSYALTDTQVYDIYNA